MSLRRNLPACAVLLAAAAIGCSDVPSATCTRSSIVVEDQGNTVTSGTLLLTNPAATECGAEDGVDNALTRSGVLTAPGFVHATILPDRGGVEITWIDANAAEDGYLIQRRQAGIPQWAIIDVYPPDTSSAVDPVDAESVSYFYRVVAFQNGITRAAPEIRVDFPDRTPPDTQLLFKPPIRTADNRATFVFVSSEGAGRFTCVLTRNEDAPKVVSCGEDLECLLGEDRCRGSWTGSNLSSGTYTFEVAARDLAGNEDPTPAKYTWEVDREPPVLSITPPPPVKVYASDNITIHFNSDDPDAEYWCTVSTAGGAVPPVGPQRCDPATGFTFSYGKDGVQRTFSLTATDQLGNSGPPATHSFWIDRTPPEIDFVAPATTFLQPSNALTVTVSLSDSGTDVLDPTALFPTGFTEVPARCWLHAPNTGVNQLIDPCLTGLAKEVQLNINLTGLPVTDGDYTLAVTVEDVLGNVGTGTLRWHFDSLPPTPAFTHTPTDPTNPPATIGDPVTVYTSVAVYDWRATNPLHSASGTSPSEREQVRAWYCSFDEPGFNNMSNTPCSPPLVITGIAPSPPSGWNFSVTGVDLAGNVSAPRTHNLHVTYGPWSTSLADAAGTAVRFNNFTGVEGRREAACAYDGVLDDVNPKPFDPFLDPHFVGTNTEGGATADALVVYSGATSRDVAGRVAPNSGEAPAYITPPVPASPTGTLTPGLYMPGTGLRVDCKGQPWSFQVSIRDSDNQPDPAAPALGLFHLGMAPPANDHVILRAAHPPYDWVLRGGETWQATVKVDRKLSATPDTWTVALDVPPRREAIDENAISAYLAQSFETLASRTVTNGALLITREHEGYLDVVGEAPHCSGMVQIRVEAWQGGTRLGGDFVRLPVSTPASGADSREPDDAWATRLGPLPVTGGLTLMNRTLTTGDADFVELGLDYSRPFTVTLVEPTQTGTPIWLGIYENAALAQQVGGASGTLSISNFAPIPGNAYAVEVSAAAVSSCLRYYLRVEQ